MIASASVALACLLMCRTQLLLPPSPLHRLTPSPSPGTSHAWIPLPRWLIKAIAFLVLCPCSAFQLILSNFPAMAFPFCREGPGVSYALNWALAATGVTPSGTVSRNLKAAKLAELSKGSAGTPTSHSPASHSSTSQPHSHGSAMAPFCVYPTSVIGQLPTCLS